MLRFTKSESAKLKLQNQQLKEIKNLYKNAAINVAKRSDALKNKGSYVLQKEYLNKHVKELKKEITNVNNQIKQKVTDGAKATATEVVKENEKFLGKLGIGIKGAFNYVPDKAVKQIISGNVYNNSWTLSAAIWGTNKKQLHDIDTIVATGLAENKPIYDIAKDLETYVLPDAKKPWDWSKRYPNTNKVIDYNAQRLARTMSNHAYQKAFQMTTEKNPFVEYYRWNNGHTNDVCPICQELASKDSYGLGGGIFPKDEIPLDHPNGFCFITAEILPQGQVVDKLADWVNGEGDPDFNKQLDDFAKDMGFKIEAVKSKVNLIAQSEYKSMTYKQAYDEFLFKTSTQYSEAQDFWKAMSTGYKSKGYASKEEYWKALISGKEHNKEVEKILKLRKAKEAEKVIKTAKVTTIEEDIIASKIAKGSEKNYSYWLSKLSAEEKEVAKELKNKSGLKWKEFYDKYFYQPKNKVKVKATKLDKVKSNIPDVKEWINICKKNTTKGMLDIEDEAMKIIGQDGVSGLKRYTGSSYQEMNEYLRCLHKGMSEAEAIKKSYISGSQLDDLKNAINGLKNYKMPKDIVVRRGSSEGDLAGILFKDLEYREAKSKVMDELIDNGVDYFNKTYSGKIGNFGGFTSTSSIWDKGFSGSFEYMFYIPEGTDASSIMSISQYGTAEGETLLNANAKVKFHHIERSDGHKSSRYRVYFEVLK